MSNTNQNVSMNCGGIFAPLLTVLFIGLKLTNYIDWSWWWVLSPLWIGAAVGIIVLVIVLLIAIVVQK